MHEGCTLQFSGVEVARVGGEAKAQLTGLLLWKNVACAYACFSFLFFTDGLCIYSVVFGSPDEGLHLMRKSMIQDLREFGFW